MESLPHGFFPIAWRHAFGSGICPDRDFAAACTELQISKHEAFVSDDWPPGGQTLSGCWLASIQDLDPRGPVVSAGDVDLVGSDVSQGMLSSHALLLRTAGAAVLSRADASEAGKNGPGMADALHSRPGAFSAGPGEFLVRGAWPCLHWFERLGQTKRSDASSTAMPGAQEAPLLRAADPLGLPGGDAPRAGRGVPLSARAHIRAGLTAILGNNSSVLFSQAYRRICYSNKKLPSSARMAGEGFFTAQANGCRSKT